MAVWSHRLTHVIDIDRFVKATTTKERADFWYQPFYCFPGEQQLGTIMQQLGTIMQQLGTIMQRLGTIMQLVMQSRRQKFRAATGGFSHDFLRDKLHDSV